MPKKSSQIALGGMFSALCLVIMFLTGVVPFAMFALPALAGAMLIAVVVEMGAKTAVMVYVSVSVLSAFIVANRAAALVFILFLGYYPILKAKLETCSRSIEIAIKFAVFNLLVIAAYMLAIHLFGAQEALEQMDMLGQLAPVVLLALGNAMFFIYDIALSKYASLYTHRLRKRLLRRW